LLLQNIRPASKWDQGTIVNNVELHPNKLHLRCCLNLSMYYGPTWFGVLEIFEAKKVVWLPRYNRWCHLRCVQQLFKQLIDQNGFECSKTYYDIHLSKSCHCKSMDQYWACSIYWALSWMDMGQRISRQSKAWFWKYVHHCYLLGHGYIYIGWLWRYQRVHGCRIWISNDCNSDRYCTLWLYSMNISQHY